MPISSSALFHFTNNIEKFQSIISNGFRVNVSIETNSILKGRNKHAKFALAIPMVCFCDIPISLVKNHVKIYGGRTPFGLGLSRAWGIKNCSPVIYSDPDGPFRDSTATASMAFKDLLATETLSAFTESAYRRDYIEIYTSFRNEVEKQIVLKADLYFKPIVGDYNYGGAFKSSEPKFPDYTFYDEREWRYIPGKIERLPYYGDLSFWRKRAGFLPEQNIENFFTKYVWEFHKNKRDLYGKFENLKFESTDIEYIIVDTDETLKQIIKWLLSADNESTIGGNTLKNRDDIYLLISKLISYENIQNNIFAN